MFSRVGKRHDVQYEAGADTGFHVKSGHPDSDVFGGVFYSGPPGKLGGRPRGHSSVVLGKDGSYGFTASGPDQRRSEVSDSSGRVQGSYTYLDDKGVQRTVQYVAGPDIGYRVVNNAAAAGGLTASAVSVVQPLLLPTVPPPPSLQSSSPPLLPSAIEQDLFGPAASTPATLSDRRRPDSVGINSAVKNNENNGGGGNDASNEFLSPDSTLPLNSAFPEDDPSLPPKKWPTVYKDENEQSFFQSFEKFDKRNKEHRHGSNNRPAPLQPLFGVPDSPSSYGLQPIANARPQYSSSSGSGGRPTRPSDTLYGQPSRPIVVDQKYGQYGGTDYQKPKDHNSALHEFGGAGHADNTYNRFPTGTIVKAHVQNLDILPFGHRVPSPSYVLEKQFGNSDGYDNSIRK